MNSPLNMHQFASDCFRAYYLHLLYLSTNQLIHSLLIRTKWTTGNGTLMSSSHWPIFKKSIPLIKYSWAWPILAKFQNNIEMMRWRTLKVLYLFDIHMERDIGKCMRRVWIYHIFSFKVDLTLYFHLKLFKENISASDYGGQVCGDLEMRVLNCG